MVNLNEILRSHIRTVSNMLFQLNNIQNVADLIINAYKNGNKVLVCGNGGSAVDAEHFVAELVSKFKINRKGLNAIALSSNNAVITAIGNDFDYDEIFSRQVIAYVNEGDIVIGITTSGKSKNVLNALEKAKELNAIPVLITGLLTGDYENNISILSTTTARIQEGYLLAIHMIAEIVEDTLFNE